MHRVARDDMARHVEFLEELLHGGDFIGLLVDLDMRQHQRRVDGERAEHLSCLEVVEAIETALESFAIERQEAAYSSDNVPVHLLTREAMALYRSILRPDGAIVMNITNRNI